jgi:tetratricopeptide (TPR) repeat protein
MASPPKCIACQQELFVDLTVCGMCGKRQPSPKPSALEPVAAPVASMPPELVPIAASPALPPVPKKSGAVRLIALVLITVLAGGGYWTWAQKQASEQRVVELEKKQAEEARRRQEEDSARGIKEAEERGRKDAEEKLKQEISQKEAEERAKAEVEKARKDLEEQQGAQSRSSVQSMERAARCSDTRECLTIMLGAADPRSTQVWQAAATRLSELTTTKSGDTVAARDLNKRGIDEYRRGNKPAAIDLLTRAARTDASDAEIQTNLGFVLLRAERKEESWPVLARALQLDPRRGPTWHTVSEYFVYTAKSDLAVRALLINFELSKAKEQALANFEKQAQTYSNVDMRPVYELAIIKIKAR